VRLVEEEHEARFVRIPDLRQVLEQLREQPQQEGGVDAGTAHELIGRQHVHLAGTVRTDADHVVEIQRRLAEELLAALAFDDQQPSHDRSDRLLRHVAVLPGESLRVVADVLERGA
jgi:hypothetical protein